MSQGGAPSTGACDFAVLRAVPGPSWGPLRLALPAVIEQFEPLIQGDECLSKRHAQASMPNDDAQSNQRSRHVSLRHDPRLEASSQPSLGLDGHGSSHDPRAVRRATTPCHPIEQVTARSNGFCVMASSYSWLGGKAAEHERHGRFRNSVLPSAEGPDSCIRMLWWTPTYQ